MNNEEILDNIKLLLAQKDYIIEEQALLLDEARADVARLESLLQSK